MKPWDSAEERKGNAGGRADGRPEGVAGRFIGSFVFQNPPDLHADQIRLIDSHVPDDLIVDAEVIMDHLIAHSGNRTPLNIRASGPDSVRNILNCLADDLETPYKGAFERWIPHEPLLIRLSKLISDESDLIKHML